MRFSVKYLPTTLFSLKESNATNSGAKSLFLPSPYAIKMAILNQAITIGGDLEGLNEKKSEIFEFIRDLEISFYIEENNFFSVNNSFVKILKPSRNGSGFAQTVAFREYVFLSGAIEIICNVSSEVQKQYLQKYLHKINYFGKRGCFFQFLAYDDKPNEPNVLPFNIENMQPGILQEYDDFDPKASFATVNSYDVTTGKRRKQILVLPVSKKSSSKSFSLYKT
jgi:hypothetical protein